MTTARSTANVPLGVNPPAVAPLAWSWFLGQPRYQRLCLRFWLLTTSVYLVHLFAIAIGVYQGAVLVDHAAWIAGLALIGHALIYSAIRSGWSKRLDDAAMTRQQMAFAFLYLSLSYLLVPGLRTMQMVASPLVLIFGAFTLTPQQCRGLGYLAIGSLGLSMYFTWLQSQATAVSTADVMAFLLAFFVFSLTAEMAGRLSAMRLQLRTQKRDLALAMERNLQLARQDELTGLPNRRHALEMMDYEARRAARELVPPSVCLIDLDHFKNINDTYGHSAGDAVLRLVATHAAKSLRSPDLLARWGGEEFLLVMPNTMLPDALVVVQRVRSALAQASIWQAQPELQVTFSAGVAARLPGESMDATVARADAALYQAKHSGRNCSVVADASALVTATSAGLSASAAKPV